MRDELMYPRAFALMHIKSATDEFYVVSPCYVIKEIKNAFKSDRTSESCFEVVFPRKKLGLTRLFAKKEEEEIIPEINPSNSIECTNSTFVNFITCDYKDAIQKRDSKNFSRYRDPYEIEGLIKSVESCQEDINKLESDEIAKINKLKKTYDTTYEPELWENTRGTYRNGMVFIKKKTPANK